MEAPASPSPLVAIVDDEQDIVTYLQLALEDHGYRVVAITESSTAIERLKATEPDFICLDLLMPKHTGVALYEEIVHSPDLEDCSVLIMSGLTQKDEFSSLLERAGGLPEPPRFLEKPIRIKQLLEALRELEGVAT